MALALSACSLSGKEESLKEGLEEADTVFYAEESEEWVYKDGKWVASTEPQKPLYDASNNRWYGKGSERLNRAWEGRIALDTIDHK